MTNVVWELFNLSQCRTLPSFSRTAKYSKTKLLTDRLTGAVQLTFTLLSSSGRAVRCLGDGGSAEKTREEVMKANGGLWTVFEYWNFCISSIWCKPSDWILFYGFHIPTLSCYPARRKEGIQFYLCVCLCTTYLNKAWFDFHQTWRAYN